MTILLLILFGYLMFGLGRWTATRRAKDTPERAAKMRQQAYTRWYEGQLREDERLRAKQDPEAYRPHAAVNLLTGTGA